MQHSGSAMHGELLKSSFIYSEYSKWVLQHCKCRACAASIPRSCAPVPRQCASPPRQCCVNAAATRVDAALMRATAASPQIREELKTFTAIFTYSTVKFRRLLQYSASLNNDSDWKDLRLNFITNKLNLILNMHCTQSAISTWNVLKIHHDIWIRKLSRSVGLLSNNICSYVPTYL
jgi:hypothetical protein